MEERKLNMFSFDGGYWSQYAILSESLAKKAVALKTGRIVAADEAGNVVYATHKCDRDGIR